MQVAVIEFARHRLNMAGAHSTEFDRATAFPVIAMITEWQDKALGAQQRSEKSDLGGTMRLGAQEVTGRCTTARTLYGAEVIRERHRIVMSSTTTTWSSSSGDYFQGFRGPAGRDRGAGGSSWFVATQFHPEFTSNPRDGHPLFTGFVKAARAARAAQLPAAAAS
jgi:CTP synthase